MKRMLVVPTVVVAFVIIGMIAVFPSATASHTNNSGDKNICNKWYFKAINEYAKKYSVPPGIEKFVKKCLDNQIPAPENLPPMDDSSGEQDKPVIPTSGLIVKFSPSTIDIPGNAPIIEVILTPCQAGEIILDKADIEFGSFVGQLSQEISLDRNSLLIKASNPDTKLVTLEVNTPCLAMIDS